MSGSTLPDNSLWPRHNHVEHKICHVRPSPQAGFLPAPVNEDILKYSLRGRYQRRTPHQHQHVQGGSDGQADLIRRSFRSNKVHSLLSVRLARLTYLTIYHVKLTSTTASAIRCIDLCIAGVTTCPTSADARKDRRSDWGSCDVPEINSALCDTIELKHYQPITSYCVMSDLPRTYGEVLTVRILLPAEQR